MRARNFSPEELSEAVTLCSVYGVKCYVALNTRVFDRERRELEEIVSLDGVRRADGFIVADPGLALMLRERLPHVPLHASTQITGVTAADARMLGKLGFVRMVAPRELSAERISRLVRDSGMEIEMFIHGAHCVSYSGQCLMSYAMGGRSPNRGECAQPCRMRYAVEGKNGEIRADKNGYPLSLRDMCLARHIPEIIDSGVASLKIEGRQKGADYVRGVTATYRRLLDERRAATDGEMRFLEELFSRSGFTDGYFTDNKKKMTGVRPDGEGDRTAAKKDARVPDLKVRAAASVRLLPGEPAKMTLSDGEKTVTVLGDAPEAAATQPLTEETVVSSVVRTGSTPFSLDPSDVTVELGEGLWMTRSRLNDLRRSATDALLAAHREPAEEPRREGAKRPPFPRPERVLKLGSFTSAAQVTEKALRYFDILFLPEGELYGIKRGDGEKLGVALPPVGCDDGALGRTLERARGAGVRFALANTFSELGAAKETGFDVTASARFNVTSTDAAGAILSLGADRVTASVETGAAALSRFGQPVGGVVYGRFPVMLTARCILSDVPGDGCAMEKNGPVFLRDRKGARMPVLRLPDCMNLILNTNPVWMADRGADLGAARLSHLVFLFTVESPGEVDRVIDAYENGDAPDDPRKIRRI